jgi:glycine/D-amino acid oxidase-like deaminating enzyme
LTQQLSSDDPARMTGRLIVVGGGVFGVASALELRARGYGVVVVETGRTPRPQAASTDISKIVRMDYGADAFYTALMERAIPLWRGWNRRWERPLFHEDGFLLLSRAPIGPGTFEGDSLAMLTRRGHPLERLRPGMLEAQWPAWSDGGYTDGYFNPVAGWAESGAVLAMLTADARSLGVEFHEDDPCVDLRAGAAVTAAGAILSGDVVLLAAGAWTPRLAPQLAHAMWPVAQPVFHLRPADPAPWRPPSFTVWAADIARTGWYGFPANADGIVKIANHGPGRRVDPDAPRAVTAEDERSLRAFLRESLPALAEAPLCASKTCLYCDAFDGDLWVGRDPEQPWLAVAAGDSGHGFKFAPVLGEIVADAIEGKLTESTARLGWRAPAGRRTEDARFGLS